MTTHMGPPFQYGNFWRRSSGARSTDHVSLSSRSMPRRCCVASRVQGGLTGSRMHTRRYWPPRTRGRPHEHVCMRRLVFALETCRSASVCCFKVVCPLTVHQSRGLFRCVLLVRLASGQWPLQIQRHRGQVWWVYGTFLRCTTDD